MPKWDELAWAAFLYGYVGGDPSYQNLMSQTQLRSRPRTNPMDLGVADIRNKLIAGFLNRWKCRLLNSDKSARAIQSTLQNATPLLRALKDITISTFELGRPLRTRGLKVTVQQAIESCYKTIANLGFKFGATATSKLLHVLNPKLFVMWDRRILHEYKNRNTNVSDTPSGYSCYLGIMKTLARQICDAFQKTGLNPQCKTGEEPAEYLSTKMGYKPPKTMAKFLDEYNWLTITNRVQVPPSWHP